MRYLLCASLLFVILFTGCGNPDPTAADQEGILEVNGTELFFKRMGKGEPIVVVHGGPVLDHSYLLPHLKPLANDYELIFYDQRLSGRSSAAVDSSDVTLQNFVDDIEGLRTSLGLNKIHILAHSWGALLAMKYAVRYPEHVGRLILSDAMPPSTRLWQQEQVELAKRTAAEDRKAREAIVTADGFDPRSPESIEKLLLLSFRNKFHDSTYADGLDLYVPDDYRKRSGLFGLLMPELQNYNLLPDLADLQIPTLIIYGSDEPAAEISGKKLDQTIPNSKMVLIKQSGHFPFIEQQKRFMEVVRDFLK